MSKLIPETPIYYTGKKYTVIKQGLIDLFPKNISTFYDLFCGSGIVSYNTNARHYVLNDVDSNLISIFKMFKYYCNNYNSLIDKLHKIIDTYQLEVKIDNGLPFDKRKKNFSKESYDYHNECYKRLVADYNEPCEMTADDILTKSQLLYVLTVYSFSHQFRYNTIGLFNMPVGPGNWTRDTEENIKDFMVWLDKNTIMLSNCDYSRAIAIDYISDNSFIYLDPPYYNTVATYTENGKWTIKDDLKLFDFCDKLTKHGISWGMNNIILSDKSNSHLTTWIKCNDYHCHIFENVKYPQTSCKEVYITNYIPEDK